MVRQITEKMMNMVMIASGGMFRLRGAESQYGIFGNGCCYPNQQRREKLMWDEMSDAAKWLAVGAAIVAAVIVTGQTYPLWFFLIPALY